MVVQSRNLPSVVVASLWQRLYQGKLLPVTNGSATNSFQGGFQTTDSYRSGKNWQNLESQGFTSSSGSWINFIRELDSENKTGFGNAPYDTGHPFFTDKTEYFWPPKASATTRNGPFGDYDYSGYYLPYLDQITGPTISLPSASRKNADGAKLIGMTIPTKPEMALAQFLGELREGLPQIMGANLRDGVSVRRAFFPSGAPRKRKNLRVKGTRYAGKSAGNEYLNYEFGVLPFISDIQKMAQGVLRANKHVEAYLRNSDHVVRRRAHLDSDGVFQQQPGISSPVIVHVPSSGMDGQMLTVNRPITDVYDSIKSNVWFSGAYTFHVAEGHSFLSRMERYAQKANNLLGLEITPQLVWELTPWSWLIDWFADVNGFLRNVQAFSDDSLVLKYGYVMHETVATRAYSKTGMVPRYEGSVPASSTIYVTRTVKQRTKATPYGFGLDVQAFSPTRWAILGALGLTKSPTSLRP